MKMSATFDGSARGRFAVLDYRLAPMPASQRTVSSETRVSTRGLGRQSAAGKWVLPG